ncbi:unnamed protein product [Phytomonas sp. EM1]|nr:unnamed protein product [Phytomonas sp. EM1]|eukprot:CCW65648.1 unnamed protein product [Phytomonas sp. isolate EM1]
MEVVVRVEPPILVLLLHPRPSPREILVEGAAAMAKEVRALMAPFGKGPLRSPVVATCGVLEHLISPLEMAALSHFTGEAVCRAVAELHAELRALHPRSSIGWLRWDPDGGLYGNAIRDLLPDTARRLTRLMRATRMTKTYGVDADHWVAIDSGIVHVSLHHEEVLGVVIQGIPQLQACLDFVARLQRIVL